MAKLCPNAEGVMKTLDEKRMLSKWFAHSANWFVLFVQTRDERRIAKQLQKKLDADKYVVFCPTKDYAFKKAGKVESRRVPLFSGYVFIAATVSAEECSAAVTPLILNEPDVYRFLGNPNEPNDIALSEHDKSIMTALLDENFNVPALEAVAVGDRVQLLTNGILDGESGRVVKVKKNKRSAVIEVDVFDRTITCEVMLEFIAKPIATLK
jgi:transcription antitermination factor NusG